MQKKLGAEENPEGKWVLPDGREMLSKPREKYCLSFIKELIGVLKLYVMQSLESMGA